MTRIAGGLWLPWILLLGLAAARPGRAGDDAIVLTNQDVEALHARAPAERVETPPAALAAGSGTEARTEAPNPIPSDEYKGPVRSWRDEYYRLKSEALRRALERGDPIDLGDDSDVPPPEADAEVDPTARENAPACVYDRDGSLIHTPRGADCRPQRQLQTRGGASHASPSGAQTSCVYGAQGEALLTPAGRLCERSPGVHPQAR